MFYIVVSVFLSGFGYTELLSDKEQLLPVKIIWNLFYLTISISAIAVILYTSPIHSVKLKSI